ncbi:MAG: methyltransferase domain-containing protein [Actinobacteria bacterium]|nr:methyltransferase domain-containing protein [Actinomycetota bacterium]
MPVDYEQQARTYDLTRSASPTVFRLLEKHLGPAEGRSLLDVAGGTGNYAQVLAARGFRVTVVDRAAAMLGRVAGKIGPGRAVRGDATRLPFAGAAFDAVAMVSALHQLPDQPGALAEARRVVRDGPFVLMAFTRENLAPLFLFEYFPGSAPPSDMHMTAAEIEEALLAGGFREVERETFVYVDTADGSLSALHTDALSLAGPAYLRNTSFFHRIDDDVRREGLARLAEDLRSGRLRERVDESFRLAIRQGHGTIFRALP